MPLIALTSVICARANLVVRPIRTPRNSRPVARRAKMARVKGGTATSTPATRFPAATAFTRSRGGTSTLHHASPLSPALGLCELTRRAPALPETPVKPSLGDGALRRSASPAVSRSRQSRSRSRSRHGDDAHTIVAATIDQNHADDNDDDPAAQLLQETRSVSLGAVQSDRDGNVVTNEGDEYNDVTEAEQSSEREYEEDASDIEMQEPGEAERAGAKADEGPDEGEFEIEKICSFQLADVEAPKSRSATKAPAAAAVLLEIKWRGYPCSANTLEPESEVQASAGPLLYKFWAAQGGRDKALGLSPQTSLYVPFRILGPVEAGPGGGGKRRREKRGRPKLPRYLVQWLGYDVAQATRETERKLREIAPELLDEYLSQNPGSAFSPRFPG